MCGYILTHSRFEGTTFHSPGLSGHGTFISASAVPTAGYRDKWFELCDLFESRPVLTRKAVKGVSGVAVSVVAAS